MQPNGRPTQWLAVSVGPQVVCGVVSLRESALAAELQAASPPVMSAMPWAAHDSEVSRAYGAPQTERGGESTGDGEGAADGGGGDGDCGGGDGDGGGEGGGGDIAVADDGVQQMQA